MNTLMRHFRMKFIVQELEDRVNAVVGNGHLLVFPEFLSLMAGKMTGTEDAFMDAEEADRCSAASSVPLVAAAHVAGAAADNRLERISHEEQLRFNCVFDQPPSSRCPPWCQGRVGDAASALAALRP